MVQEIALAEVVEEGVALAPTNQMAMLVPEDYDPVAQLEQAQRVVQFMSAKCSGPDYISNISGRNYPKVDWWTTVGMALSLFPVEESVERVEADDPREIKFLAIVSVRRNGQVVTKASHVASSKEGKPWGNNEYSVRSMAVTRATGKAYRIGLSGLAVLAGLEPTPAEEMPQAPPQPRRAPARAQAEPKASGPSEKQVEAFTEIMAWALNAGEITEERHKKALAWAKTVTGPTVAKQTREWEAKRKEHDKDADTGEAPPSAAEVVTGPQKGAIKPVTLSRLKIAARSQQPRDVVALVAEKYKIMPEKAGEVDGLFEKLSEKNAQELLGIYTF